MSIASLPIGVYVSFLTQCHFQSHACRAALVFPLNTASLHFTTEALLFSEHVLLICQRMLPFFKYIYVNASMYVFVYSCIACIGLYFILT